MLVCQHFRTNKILNCLSLLCNSLIIPKALEIVISNTAYGILSIEDVFRPRIFEKIRERFMYWVTCDRQD